MLGTAAMLLSFDVEAEAIAEHDDWHTHEHFPERLSIPGFRHGSRWVAQLGGPRYFVMYEVESLATLQSAAYLARLNNPTPWTTAMMKHYRGMRRGFCSIAGSFGAGFGKAAILVHFKPLPAREAALARWLLEDALPSLPSRPGFASARLFQAAATPPATNEQRIRGNDTAVNWAVLVTGYGSERVTRFLEAEFSIERFAREGATGVAAGLYRMEYSLTAGET